MYNFIRRPLEECAKIWVSLSVRSLQWHCTIQKSREWRIPNVPTLAKGRKKHCFVNLRGANFYFFFQIYEMSINTLYINMINVALAFNCWLLVHTSFCQDLLYKPKSFTVTNKTMKNYKNYSLLLLFLLWLKLFKVFRDLSRT